MVTKWVIKLEFIIEKGNVPELNYRELNNLTFYSMLSVLQGGMWMLNDMELYLKPFNLSHGRFSILLTLLGSTNKSLNPVELAEKLGKSKPTITKMIEKLISDGLVSNTDDSRDKRRKLIILTAKAVNLLNIIIPEYNKRISSMSKNLTDSDKKQLMEIIAKIDFLDPAKEIMVKQ